jgi:molybdopterin/thiamine biosynthesis adenylyltransferase
MLSFDKTEREEFSVAMPATLNSILRRHLLRNDRQEEVAFALYKPSVGSLRFTSVIHKVILPDEGDRKVQGNVLINPQYFRRVCKIASAEKSGIVLLHSHLGPGWQGMSFDDIKTECSYSDTSLTLSGLPFVGLTLGTDGTWSARIWEYVNEWYERKLAATVRVVGQRLNVSYCDSLRPRPTFKETFKRTMTVWGEDKHAHLARLRVGIIGLGSVGSMVSESLSRMGVERFILIDFDEVQEHNLDRLLGATQNDLGAYKVYVAQRQIHRASTANRVQITPVLSGITEEIGYRNALDCDIIFSCVDRPWPRQVLNHLAYSHLIPVIDGGIQVRMNSKTQKFDGAEWQVQTVGPERSCLQCLKAYDPADVATEKAGKLDDPSYLAGLPKDHRFKRNENIFPFSANLASLEVMQFIEQVTGIGKVNYYGTQRYDYNNGRIRINDEHRCEEGCLFQEGIALADSLFPPPVGYDYSAEAARDRQNTL